MNSRNARRLELGIFFLLFTLIWIWIGISTVFKSNRRDPLPYLDLCLLSIPIYFIAKRKETFNYHLITLWWMLLYPILFWLSVSAKAKNFLFNVINGWWHDAIYWTSLGRIFTILGALFLCWSMLIAVQSPNWTSIFVFVDLLLLFVLLISTVRWVSNPTGPFEELIRYTEKLISKESSLRIKATSDGITQSQLEHRNFVEDLICNFYSIGSEIVRTIISRGITTIFFLVLMCLFFVTVTSYAVAIYALQWQDGTNYGGLDCDLIHCWIFSLSILTTAPVSNVILQSDLAYVLYGLELICTFVIASVLFSMFSTALGHRGDEHRKTLLSKLSEIDQIRTNSVAELVPTTKAVPP